MKMIRHSRELAGGDGSRRGPEGATKRHTSPGPGGDDSYDPKKILAWARERFNEVDLRLHDHEAAIEEHRLAVRRCRTELVQIEETIAEATRELWARDPTKCSECGRDIRFNAAGPGRTREYCSPACRTAAYRRRQFRH